MEKKIIGHETQREYLQSCIKSNQLSHAYFFVGPAHVGKMTIASWFMDTLAPVERIFLPSDEQTSISLDDIRDLLEKLSRSNHDGGYRAICISHVDTLNAQAGNALLKCLEEPPKKTVFILCADQEQGVLQTLVSRCAIVRFSLLPLSDIIAALQMRGCTKGEQLAALSAGRPGCALRLMEDPTYCQLVEKADDVLKKTANKPVWQRLVPWQNIESTDALECAELSAHLSLRECLESDGPGPLLTRRAKDSSEMANRIMQLRRVPVLQSSKSLFDRLFI